ncbi:hypothetical protein [Nonlabens agnitus]|uniref:Outer membrane protein beta-barrel domain-containing protein n=1 Tax=Nonlabens agnitus TaxID=870484 RepID=A0A2S9WRD6_9FLAO|nr:hypothetical protein [Nonlabens agnitus]PRP66047.1 hypothetical protein BST86_02580 [Nonlabens agnitus]
MPLQKSIAQTEIDQSINLTIGKPTFPDVQTNENNYFVALEYQKQFKKWIALGFKLEYAATNDFPDNLNETSGADPRFIGRPSNETLFAGYAEIDAVSIQGTINLFLVNNKRWSFGAHGGGGYIFTTSRYFFVTRVGFDLFTDETIDYENVVLENDFNEFHFSTGLFVDYKFLDNYFVGLKVAGNFTIDDSEFGAQIEDVPVFPNYYSAGIRVGYRF